MSRLLLRQKLKCCLMLKELEEPFQIWFDQNLRSSGEFIIVLIPHDSVPGSNPTRDTAVLSSFWGSFFFHNSSQCYCLHRIHTHTLAISYVLDFFIYVFFSCGSVEREPVLRWSREKSSEKNGLCVLLLWWYKKLWRHVLFGGTLKKQIRIGNGSYNEQVRWHRWAITGGDIWDEHKPGGFQCVMKISLHLCW